MTHPQRITVARVKDTVVVRRFWPHNEDAWRRRDTGEFSYSPGPKNEWTFISGSSVPHDVLDQFAWFEEREQSRLRKPRKITHEDDYPFGGGR